MDQYIQPFMKGWIAEIGQTGLSGSSGDKFVLVQHDQCLWDSRSVRKPLRRLLQIKQVSCSNRYGSARE